MPVIGQLAAQTNLLQFVGNFLELHSYTKAASTFRVQTGRFTSNEFKVFLSFAGIDLCLNAQSTRQQRKYTYTGRYDQAPKMVL